MGSPIMPVPGMPTPMAFFRMLALSNRLIVSGLRPSVSAALAVQRATAIGSVQPMAGTTSLCMSFIILLLVSLSCMVCMFVLFLFAQLPGSCIRKESTLPVMRLMPANVLSRIFCLFTLLLSYLFL